MKRTEGLVTLIVSNPGKKAPAMNGTDATPDGVGKGQLKVSGPPSRPATPVPGKKSLFVLNRCFSLFCILPPLHRRRVKRKCRKHSQS